MNRNLKAKVNTGIGKIIILTESGEQTVLKLDKYFSEKELSSIKNVASYTVILNKANFYDASLQEAIKLWFQSKLISSLSEKSRYGKLFGDLLRTCLFFREEGAMVPPEETEVKA